MALKVSWVKSCNSIKAELDGLTGDRHRSFERESWGAGYKQPEGTRRRNERQWSAVSIEELAEITTAMDLKEPLLAATLGANLCLEGIPNLSRLPKGTILKFPSGAELMVEEYNHPAWIWAKSWRQCTVQILATPCAILLFQLLSTYEVW